MLNSPDMLIKLTLQQRFLEVLRAGMRFRSDIIKRFYEDKS
jgi:hypothetical protein